MPGLSKVPPTRLGFLPALAFLWLASVPGVAEQRVARHGRWLTPEEAAALPAPPASRAEPSWGTLDTSTRTIGVCEATSRSPAFPADILNCEIAIPSNVPPSSTSLAFPVQVPSGALLEAVTLNYYDTHPGLEPSAGFYRIGATGVLELLIAMEPPPTAAGNTSVTFTPAAPHQVDNEGFAYAALVSPFSASESEYQGVYNVSVRYRLQVSPAPAFATFTDVPEGHMFHRFVEALAASGITAGCGGGNFCVDAAVTRGQMAAFLSIALGLHFPN